MTSTSSWISLFCQGTRSSTDWPNSGSLPCDRKVSRPFEKSLVTDGRASCKIVNEYTVAPGSNASCTKSPFSANRHKCKVGTVAAAVFGRFRGEKLTTGSGADGLRHAWDWLETGCLKLSLCDEQGSIWNFLGNQTRLPAAARLPRLSSDTFVPAGAPFALAAIVLTLWATQ